MTTFRFGDGNWWVPDLECAQVWERSARPYWQLVIGDYRDRVRTYYADQYEDEPDAFPIMRPIGIYVVVSLARSWVFATRSKSDTDEIVVDARWEDGILAASELLHEPNHEHQARAVAGLDDDYELLEATDMTQSTQMRHGGGMLIDPFDNMRAPGIHMVGWNLADFHARRQKIEGELAAMRSRRLDRRQLRQLTMEFQDLTRQASPQQRGLRFEDFMQRLLSAHGCEVERGKHRPGEQVDLFVHRPFRALVECRWQEEPVGAPAIALLIAKLTRDRPAIVAGLYVSVHGFTSEADTEARLHARERAVVLLNGTDLNALIAGSEHVADMVEARIDDLVRRY